MKFRKNCIYFLCPFVDNNEWRKNLRFFLRFVRIFDNQKVIAIVQGSEFVCINQIKQEFPKLNEFETILTKNDANVGETVIFKELLKKVFSVNPNEITFYAHSKGVTPGYNGKTLKNIIKWRNYMYYYCLSNETKIDNIFNTYKCCGCFKKYGKHHLINGADWHYSGTFFWFKNKELFKNKQWEFIPYNKFSVEGYLARFFSRSEAFCMFGNEPWPSNIYRYENSDWSNLLKRRYSTGLQSASMMLEKKEKNEIVKEFFKEKDFYNSKMVLMKEGVKFEELKSWVAKSLIFPKANITTYKITNHDKQI